MKGQKGKHRESDGPHAPPPEEIRKLFGQHVRELMVFSQGSDYQLAIRLTGDASILVATSHTDIPGVEGMAHLAITHNTPEPLWHELSRYSLRNEYTDEIRGMELTGFEDGMFIFNDTYGVQPMPNWTIHWFMHRKAMQ